MVINSATINKTNKQTPLIPTELAEHKIKTTIYNVGNPVPGFGSGTKRWWGSRPSPLDNWISNGNTYRNKQ